jgi:hypothetical protein
MSKTGVLARPEPEFVSVPQADDVVRIDRLLWVECSRSHGAAEGQAVPQSSDGLQQISSKVPEHPLCHERV